jgi:hypothetical protein
MTRVSTSEKMRSGSTPTDAIERWRIAAIPGGKKQHLSIMDVGRTTAHRDLITLLNPKTYGDINDHCERGRP